MQKTLGKERVTAVDFFGQGAFNKLYTVQCGAEQLMMRVSLPVEPSAKTLSEVATLEYVRRNRTLPVPRVMDFEASRAAPIGFEWMLMERMSGQPLAKVWNETKSEMSWSAKEALVQRLVRFSADMYNHQFRNVGNLFHTHTQKDSIGSDDTGDTCNFEIGKAVSTEFFWLNHATQDVPKGPFRCSRDWLAARLAFKDNDARAKVQAHNARESDASMDEEEDDEDDEWEAAERTISIVKRLRQLLDDAFSPAVLEPEPTMLFHDDLNSGNILVSASGDLTAVLDWECVSVLPVWKACDVPAFLQCQIRNEPPHADSYRRDESGVIDGLYYTLLYKHETAALRTLFLNKMREVEPRWMAVFESSQRKRDIDLAIRQCDSEISLLPIERWLTDVERGCSDRSLYEWMYGEWMF